jgi:hypothetical protein
VRISRRTLVRWLAAFTACPAVAQKRKTGNSAAASDANPVEHEVCAPGISIGLTNFGHITSLKLGAAKLDIPFRACTVLADCQTGHDVHTRALPNGGLETQRIFSHNDTGRECIVTERFLPTSSSIRWELEIVGTGTPWTTLIQTQLAWLNAAHASFWTTWDHIPGGASQWSDPLVHLPFADMALRYGGFRSNINAFCIPLVTILDEPADIALSLIQSPDDVLLDMQLKTTAAGDVILTRANHRISPSSPIRFCMDLVAHPADWRAGLGWMADRYPTYFDPPSLAVAGIDGCGAYTSYQGELGKNRFHKMAFSTNWNAHFDFPFLGMMMPPVPATESWQSWYKQPTSFERMSGYSTQMKKSGFHVLEYFNITEAGNFIQETPPPRKAKSDDDLWRDPNDFVHYRIPGAVLRDRAGKIQYSDWYKPVIVDSAEPVWQDFLIGMIRRLVKYLPNSDGICIDRMDWLTLYNGNRDDGVSWIDGRPARSLLVSWKDTLPRLAAILHKAGKFIYGNPLVMRIDANRFLDGLYAENGDSPNMLNLCALLCVRKPAIGWTRDMNDLRPDPDAMFQRHLHLGVFPTVPMTGADHTIAPDPWSDRYYLDYGPLLAAIRGKKWVLQPHVISVGSRAALANLFQVPGGYSIPITFAKNVDVVTVSLRNFPRHGERIISARVLHPGQDHASTLHVRLVGRDVEIAVPVQRGCAVATLKCGPS